MSLVTLTFSVVHMRASYLVHQQHKDKAQDQRYSDAGVKLLVTVFMFPTGTQGDICLNLCIWNLRNSSLAVTVVSTCRHTKKKSTDRGRQTIRWHSELNTSLPEWSRLWCVALQSAQTITKCCITETDVNWLPFSSHRTLLCLDSIQTGTQANIYHANHELVLPCSDLPDIDLIPQNLHHILSADLPSAYSCAEAPDLYLRMFFFCCCSALQCGWLMG